MEQHDTKNGIDLVKMDTFVIYKHPIQEFITKVHHLLQ
jgi:hypothetical protein